MKQLLLLILFFLLSYNAISQGIITTFAGNAVLVCRSGAAAGDGGPAYTASLCSPYDVAIDDSDNVYYCDFATYKVRKITVATGIISLIAGNDTSGYNGDNIPAIHSMLNNPRGLAVDHAGNVYIADASNVRIRKVTKSTGIITTIAGTGVLGYNGDNIRADTAMITGILGIATDDSNNIYISDNGNYSVRKISATTGMITRVVGNGSGSIPIENSLATQTPLLSIWGISLDKHRNIYIADASHNKIYKVDAVTNRIHTFAGTGMQGFSGDNGPATQAALNFPNFVKTDTSGNVYISDQGNVRVRKVDVATGIITTVAGNGMQGFYGDGGSALNAKFSVIRGVASDNSGSLYICDPDNYRIRKVVFPSGINQSYQMDGFSIYPNPSSGIVTLHTPSQSIYQISIYNNIGQLAFQTNTDQQDTQLQLSNLPAGSYVIRLSNSGNVFHQQLIISQ